MSRHSDILTGRLVRRNQIVLLVYRILSLVAAGIQIVLFHPGNIAVAPNIYFIVLAVVVSIGISFLPVFIRQPFSLRWAILVAVADCSACVFLLAYTGVLFSPFLPFALSPVLNAALFMGSKFTSTVLVAVGIAVIWTQFLVDNPFSPVDPFLISRLAIVIAFIILSAALPFIVNMNIRRIIAEENVRKERLRLSREIHDGVAQTLHALCWQTQQVRERLGPLSEADEAHFRRLEKLAVQARQDVLEALEILRSYDKTGDFKILLQESLQNLKQYHEINYDLSIEPEEIRLGKHVELELLRICQESLANIRRHSHARHVKVRIKQLEESLELSIQDDGQGFDSMAYFRRKGAIRDHHGLLMMQERVQQINGHLQVLSMPERGTLIKVEVPSPSKNRL